jgi:hypothetical protein
MLVRGFGGCVLPLWWIDSDGQCACGTRCKSPGKHPIHELVPHGVKDATGDDRVVLSWWRRYPDANVGLACGACGLHLEPLHWFVLDVDPRNGGDATLAQLVREHGELPTTVTADTGGGGIHYLFRLAEGYRLRGRIGDGLDVKSAGGYIVAEPSNHASGGRYTWRDSLSPIDVPIATPPVWLVRLLLDDLDRPTEAIDASHAAPMNVVDRARRYVARCEPAVSGSGGHVATFRVAQVLVRGFALGEAQALEVLREYNLRCCPPWSERELAHKVRQASRRGRMQHGTKVAS